jgi:hypothetical protein
LKEAAMTKDFVSTGAGRITFWDLDSIDPAQPLAEQWDLLKEDLIQIEFDNHIVVDAGWYPSSSPDGQFVVVVVQNRLWLHPLFRESAHEIADLKAVLERAISIASR